MSQSKAPTSKVLTFSDFKSARKAHRVDLPELDGCVYVLPPTPLQAAQLVDSAKRAEGSKSDEMLSQLPLMSELIVDAKVGGRRIFDRDTMETLAEQSMSTFNILQQKIIELMQVSVETSKNVHSARGKRRNASALPTTSRSDLAANDGLQTPN